MPESLSNVFFVASICRRDAMWLLAQTRHVTKLMNSIPAAAPLLQFLLFVLMQPFNMRHTRGVFVVPAAVAAAAVATVAAAGLLPCGPGSRGQLAAPGRHGSRSAG